MVPRPVWSKALPERTIEYDEELIGGVEDTE